MEPQPGLFVTGLSADTWEPDANVGGLMNTLCEVPGTSAGLRAATSPRSQFRGRRRPRPRPLCP